MSNNTATKLPATMKGASVALNSGAATMKGTSVALNSGAATMKGGAKAAVMDIIMKQWSPIEVYILMFLILSIVFVREYPKELRKYADTILGKAMLFGLAITVSMKYSWINGIFIGIFTLLILSMSPRRNEGFQAAAKAKTNMKIVDDKNPWWVEAVLKENTVGIEEDDVSTSAVQDSHSVSRSNSSLSSP